MKSLLYATAFLLICLTIGVVSCSRPPQPIVTVDKEEDKGKHRPNAYQAFADAVRFTENARAGEDWARFRSGFDLLGGQFSKPEVLQKIREMAERNRPFLQSEAHLTEAERTEVELASFTTADAHYLDECFLLRDVHRSIDVNNLSPLMQADMHFRWVMRNVLLHEQTDSMIPPAFTLRRGYGSAIDRALVFLALLRQAQIEGCLIVVPEAMPQQFLVGVPDSQRSSALLFASAIGTAASSWLPGVPGRAIPDLYLFDTRLGLPLKSKDGQRWLTLDEARRDPASLQAAQITPMQAEKLEAWLVCPLNALAPRLQELQRGLSDRDTIVLYLNAPELREEIVKAARIPVSVWNPEAKGNELANSPTRSLRLFLPKQEGGIDETLREAKIARARIPFQLMFANFARFDVAEGQIPKFASQQLNGRAVGLFNQYDLQPHEMYLRGLHDSMSRRQERMAHFARDDRLARLQKDPEFRKEVADWRIKLKTAAGDAEHGDPGVRAAAQQSMQMLCVPDNFLRWLTETNNESKLDARDMDGTARKTEKNILTKVLAIGLRDYFDFELARSEACAKHEAAQHAQAILDSLREQGKATTDAQRTARDAWVVARSSWSNFYLDRLSLDSLIKRRLEHLHKRVRTDNQFQNIDQAIGLLETLHQDVQKYFHAKRCLADCIEQLQGAKAADDYLRSVKMEIVEMEKKGLLRTEIERELREDRESEWATKRLDFLANDWSEQGSYYWMKQHIDRQVTDSQRILRAP